MRATHMTQSALVATHRQIGLCCGVCRIGRRDATLGVLAVIGISAPAHEAAAVQLLQTEQLTSPHDIKALKAAAVTASTATTAVSQPSSKTASSSIVRCSGQLDPALAAAFIQAVYETAQQQQVMPEQQLQVERYKLQTQEYKYYAAANQDRMPALPYLEDNSGGLSNSTYFNFVSYVLWKVVARHLPTPQKRTAFCAAVGGALLQQLAPDSLTSLQQAAAAAGGKAPAAATISSVQQLLDLLQQRGYICGWQLVLGSLPGGWPADWSVAEQQLVGLEDVRQEQAFPAGLQFQLKLQQPADIEGCVSLRSEEDGFWSRHVSSMLAALLTAGGYSVDSVDEYFYQDSWQGPSSAAGKLLLLFGDPLQQVDVPWTPTTLVQDWTLA